MKCVLWVLWFVISLIITSFISEVLFFDTNIFVFLAVFSIPPIVINSFDVIIYSILEFLSFLLSPIYSCIDSFRSACAGLKRIQNKTKDSKMVDKYTQYEATYSKKLCELRSLKVNGTETERLIHFCNLMCIINATDQIIDIRNFVLKRKDVLLEIKKIETELFNIALAYKKMGNLEKAKRVLNQINTDNIQFDLKSFEKEYIAEQETIKKENESLKKWMFVSLVVVISTICILGYLLLSWMIKR